MTFLFACTAILGFFLDKAEYKNFLYASAIAGACAGGAELKRWIGKWLHAGPR
jgi:hypothetical protein